MGNLKITEETMNSLRIGSVSDSLKEQGEVALFMRFNDGEKIQVMKATGKEFTLKMQPDGGNIVFNDDKGNSFELTLENCH